MPIYPTEASWTPTTSPSPAALYKDGNITVYAIPILPCPVLENDEGGASLDDPVTEDHSLKRKRGNSPNIPAKRVALMAQDSGPETAAEDEPRNLVGQAAQEWRSLMIDTMFPGSCQKIKGQQKGGNNETKKSKVQGKEKGKGQSQTPSNSTTAPPKSDAQVGEQSQSSNVCDIPR